MGSEQVLKVGKLCVAVQRERENGWDDYFGNKGIQLGLFDGGGRVYVTADTPQIEDICAIDRYELRIPVLIAGLETLVTEEKIDEYGGNAMLDLQISGQPVLVKGGTHVR